MQPDNRTGCAVFSIFYNVAASSTALIGFGLASVIVIAAVAVKEGRDASRGGACCLPVPAADRSVTEEDGCCATGNGSD